MATSAPVGVNASIVGENPTGLGIYSVNLARALVAGSLAAIAGFLVAGLFEYNFGDSEVAMLAYAVMALAFAASRASKGSWGVLTVPGP